MTVSILLLTHENIGTALLNTARKTFGTLPLSAMAVPIPTDCQPERFIPKLKDILQNLDQGKKQGILILTDLFGATPCNLAHALGDEIQVHIISGLNLPMLIRVLNYPELDLNALAEKAVSGGRDGIVDSSQFCFKFQPYQYLEDPMLSTASRNAMLSKKITIINKLGLHARAAAKFVTIASRYSAQVEIGKNGQMVNGKSIMGVMMLAASQGTEVELQISGEDESEAMEALFNLINDRFGEKE